MTIKTTTDLSTNKEYYAQLVEDGKVRRIRFLGIVKSRPKPEICFQWLTNSTKTYHHFNFFGLNEIGIGTTHEEAKANYGRILDAKLPPAYDSDEDIEKDLRKIRTTTHKYEYYNYRNIKA